MSAFYTDSQLILQPYMVTFYDRCVQQILLDCATIYYNIVVYPIVSTPLFNNFPWLQGITNISWQCNHLLLYHNNLCKCIKLNLTEERCEKVQLF